MKNKYLIIIIFFICLFLITFFLIRSQSKNTFPSSSFSGTPNLHIQKSTGSYSYENTTNTFQTYFKDSPLEESSISFKTGPSRISFYTPQNQIFGQLNSSNSSAKDNTVTYQHVFTDTDLKYTITPQKLLEEFIITTQPTALKFTQISQIAKTENIDRYQNNPDGSISFYYQNEVMFVLPKPLIYELGNQENKTYGIEYQITSLGDHSYRIDKVLTSEGLTWLSHLNRDYPIAIDLVIDNGDTASNWVSSDTTNTVVSSETTIKHGGTASVKVTTSSSSYNIIDMMEDSTTLNGWLMAWSPSAILASGGTESDSGNYHLHTFKRGTHNFSVMNVGGTTVQALLVGGGGAGGDANAGTINTRGGGGGGGGLVYRSSFSVGVTTYPITVGTGGSQSSGSASTFSTLTAAGGGKGGDGKANGSNGACGGGAGASNIAANTYTGGTGSTGYDGGQTRGIDSSTRSGGAGGGGMGSAGGDSYQVSAGGNGGNGISNSITGSSIYYAGGGGGSRGGSPSAAGVGGTGGGGAGCTVDDTSPCTNGTSNRGGGGGGSCGPTSSQPVGCSGGSGIVIIKYLVPFSEISAESTIKTEGDYSFKVVAVGTASLNQTLTHSLGEITLNLSNKNTVYFDLRASRTGSNIQIGLHDTGGTTSTITPNITSANTWQTVTWDISAISNANKDAIDQIIITIVNADANNTFYFDNMYQSDPLSLNDTITATKTSTDLSASSSLSFWIYSTALTSSTWGLRFQIGETSSDEQTYTISIGSTKTWEQKIFDLSSISASARNAITKYAFKITATDTSAAPIFYFDDVEYYNSPPNTPSLDSPDDSSSVNPSDPVLLTTHTTDIDSDYLQYYIKFCTNLAMSIGCSVFDQTVSNSSWSGQNVGTSAYSSGTTAIYTLPYSLNSSTTYYWNSKAIDPGGTNTWSATQATPFSFTTSSGPTPPGQCLLQKNNTNTSVNITWVDFSSDENGFTLQRKVDSAAFANLTSLGAGITGYNDNTTSSGHTYQYRVASYYTGPVNSNWCNTPILNLQTGTIKYEGIIFQ